MVRKLILAGVILAMAAVPVPALARDGWHGAGMGSEAATSGSSVTGGLSTSGTSTGPSSGSVSLRTTTATRRRSVLCGPGTS